MGLLLPTLRKASEDKLLLDSDLEKPLESRQTPTESRGKRLLLRTAVAHPSFRATDSCSQGGYIRKEHAQHTVLVSLRAEQCAGEVLSNLLSWKQK